MTECNYWLQQLTLSCKTPPALKGPFMTVGIRSDLLELKLFNAFTAWGETTDVADDNDDCNDDITLLLLLLTSAATDSDGIINNGDSLPKPLLSEGASEGNGEGFAKLLHETEFTDGLTLFTNTLLDTVTLECPDTTWFVITFDWLLDSETNKKQRVNMENWLFKCSFIQKKYISYSDFFYIQTILNIIHYIFFIFDTKN